MKPALLQFKTHLTYIYTSCTLIQNLIKLKRVRAASRSEGAANNVDFERYVQRPHSKKPRFNRVTAFFALWCTRPSLVYLTHSR